ncbi:MAG: hypothetical protein J0652_03300 [Desulfobulbaceae bacterium]|jgi:hypothetical protein|nr:hypothetical protein [Desulfobulbaceae bacterium]
MRQYLIDDLSPMERDNIDSYLKRTFRRGPMIGLYWIVLPAEMLSELQREHVEKCGPYYCGVEVEKYAVRFEMLVRSHANLHCDCIAHATPEQRQYILDLADRMLTEEMIRS